MDQSKLKLKVCGLKYTDNVSDIIALKPDYIGFIFYPKSSRFVENFPNIQHNKHTKRVGVFVNENVENILDKKERYNLDTIQLHGNETPELCEKIRNYASVIKAFSITSSKDINNCQKFVNKVDLFLFDTQTDGYGGSGKKFDWSVLNEYKLSTPFMLSGGIGPKDVESILALNHPQLVGIDINSKFETKPGLKNTKLVKEFIHNIKR